MCRLATERGQLTRVLVDAKRCHRAAVATEAFADGEQEALRRIEHQERRINFGHHLQRSQRAAGRILAKQMNARRSPGTSVGTDVDQWQIQRHRASAYATYLLEYASAPPPSAGPAVTAGGSTARTVAFDSYAARIIS